MQINHTSDSRLIFEAEFHEGEKSSGEWMYSPRTPAKPSYYEIIGVLWNDGESLVDITDFVTEYADNLFSKWEEELNDTLN